MIDCHSLETLCVLRMQDIQREMALAARAAQIPHAVRPGNRAYIAAGLRWLARRLDPAFETRSRRPALTALSR